jgi:hypothetical protein
MESWVLLGHRYVVFLVFNYVDGHLSNTGRFFHRTCVSLSDDHIGFVVWGLMIICMLVKLPPNCFDSGH